MDDNRIVELYLLRDETAIKQTTEKYGSRLRSLACGIVNDQQTAEECENDTYMEAWNTIPPHEPRSYLYAFLARITRHISLNCCRDRNRLKRSAFICELSAELEQCIPAPDDVECRIDDIALSDVINRFLSKKNIWVKLGAMAACLCLVIGGFAAYQAGIFKPLAGTEENDTDTESAAYGFYLNGNHTVLYFPISFEERRQYELVPDDAVGLSKNNIYKITEADLGDLMGIVTDCGYEALNGCNVYHFAKYPAKDSICIVDTPSGYAFYVGSWLNVGNEIGASSDVLLSAYDLPASLEKMELLTPDFGHITDIEDAAIIESIFNILSGKTNSGQEANERRFAQAWYDAYGNDDVYYSEAYGHCMYRENPSDEEPITYTDNEGNTVVQNSAHNTSVYDKAHELWSKGERVIKITTVKGYRLTIDYFPSICTFICGDGYYELSSDETEAMNLLLQITD